ncbi:MAG: 30S ribosomal protein S6 [Actinomycetota bacterium]|nr:30S ribosomal protein S6 [Actinomycetota bacterium]
MLILPAEADEALVTTAVDRITKVIAPSGGEVTKIDRWGRKRFAYEVDRLTEGYYVVVRFTADPTSQQELDRTLKIADEVIRSKVLLLPPQKPNKKTNQHVKAKASASPASVEA